MRRRWKQLGQFCYFDFSIANPHGQTMGVIARGALGQAVGRLVAAFGIALLDRPLVVLPPHGGWAGIQAIWQLVDNIEAFARDAPRHVVTG